MRALYKELEDNLPFFLGLLLEHIKIILLAVILAILIGLSMGIIISNYRKIAKYFIAIINVLYTIPSIALLGFLISITGIGNTTAIIALTVYALLPIVRSTYIGITNIDPKIIEASMAMGSKKIQILYKIQLPLAFPIIFASIRNMVTMTIALAGIASFVGAGGLGVAIYRGITTNNKTLIVIGSILIALLAIIMDALLGLLEKFILSHKYSRKNKRKVLVFIIIILSCFIFTYVFYNNSGKKVIKIASKPTIEGYILAEMVGELIENKGNYKVEITNGVGGGTSNIHPAIVRGDFDLYPEYTGTAWQVVLKKKKYSNKDFNELKRLYREKFGLLWEGNFGFNNTYSIGIRKELAEKYNIKTYSDLTKYSKDLIFGAEYDFFEREDGYKSLTKAYNMNFKKVIDMDNGLKYEALLNGKIDAMTVFTTDGQLSNPKIVVLEDNKNFYPKYMAGIVVREDIIRNNKKIETILNSLTGIINDKTMSRLNYEVEVLKKSPKDVAHRFLIENNLLEVSNE